MVGLRLRNEWKKEAYVECHFKKLPVNEETSAEFKMEKRLGAGRKGRGREASKRELGENEL